MRDVISILIVIAIFITVMSVIKNKGFSWTYDGVTHSLNFGPSKVEVEK